MSQDDLKLQELSFRVESAEKRVDAVEDDHDDLYRQNQQLRERMIAMETHMETYGTRLDQFHEADLPEFKAGMKELQDEMRTLVGQVFEERLAIAMEREKDRVRIAELETTNESLKSDVESNKKGIGRIIGISAGSSSILVGLYELLKPFILGG